MFNIIYEKLYPLFFLLPEEVSHNIAINAIKYNLCPDYKSEINKILAKAKKHKINLGYKINNIEFPHPLGFAAGFDKNALAFHNLFNVGFSFIEIGAVTPKAQKGNPKPRIKRFTKDRVIINKMGFNNHGADKIYQRVSKKFHADLLLGINIGANKDSVDMLADFEIILEKFKNKCKFLVINISSPNTKGLRDIANKENFQKLCQMVASFKKKNKTANIFLKISPDIDAISLDNICKNYKYFDAFIISNTTIDKSNFAKANNIEGGASGTILFEKSTQLLAKAEEITAGKIPLIASGGVFSAKDVLEKIKNGASLVEIYSAFIFEGPKIIVNILNDLVDYCIKNKITDIYDLRDKR